MSEGNGEGAESGASNGAESMSEGSIGAGDGAAGASQPGDGSATPAAGKSSTSGSGRRAGSGRRQGGGRSGGADDVVDDKGEGRYSLINVETEMQAAYLDYAMSVITSRALPDVRDGLKPVQRRILFAMVELGNRFGQPYKKSARIVGEVLGKYHPHGDSPVYEAMVRMAQNFSLRYMLVDGQGNFGSVDGDPPAALRYTEARLSAIADEMLVDLDQDTVDMKPNFDETLREPTVLPAKLPNLLVNGSSGIAVGMATNIPPHNLGEVIDALTHIIDRLDSAIASGIAFDLVWARVMGMTVEPSLVSAAVKALPAALRAEAQTKAGAKATAEQTGHALLELVDERVDVTADDLMKHVKGPDFPTGGSIIGVQGISNAYTTGHGRVTIRAKLKIEDIRGGRQAIVVSELPFQVNKATLQEKIAELVRDRRIEGISDLRDESDRDGMRLVIELKRDTQPRQVINGLYKYTAMQTAFAVNMVALVDGQPRVLTLKAALTQYLMHRRQVVTRRTEHLLGRAKAREHVLEGLKIALDNLDAVIATIRASRDAESARDALMHKFKLTEIQAQAILDMQLRRLAALEREKILAELAELRKQIAYLEDLLAHPIKILMMIRQELIDLKAKYGDARRTIIIDREIVEFTEQDLIADSEVVVVVSRHDYVKRMPSDAYRAHGRASRGSVVTSSREDDAVQHLLLANTHHSILFFTNQGKAYQVKAHELPEASRQARGLPLANSIRLGTKETVTAIVAVPELDDKSSLVLVTRAGNVKRLAAADVSSARAGGLNVMSLAGDDELAWARLTNGNQELLIVSTNGQAIRFKEDEVRPSSRGSGGVRAIRLDEGEEVAGADIIEPRGELVVITKRGIGKRVPLEEFSTQGRGGGGIRAISTTARTGPVAAARIVALADDVLLISLDGVVEQRSVEAIAKLGRTAQGQIVIRLGAADALAAVARLRASENGSSNGRAAEKPEPATTPVDAGQPTSPTGAAKGSAKAATAKPTGVTKADGESAAVKASATAQPAGSRTAAGKAPGVGEMPTTPRATPRGKSAADVVEKPQPKPTARRVKDEPTLPIE